jgi:hypothetical protein
MQTEWDDFYKDWTAEDRARVSAAILGDWTRNPTSEHNQLRLIREAGEVIEREMREGLPAVVTKTSRRRREQKQQQKKASASGPQ